jgi:hypothetical protein
LIKANAAIPGANDMTHIPPPHFTEFENGISHPLLYLWDAWSYRENEILHLYCLAVSKLRPDNTPLNPIERNNFPFHIRHFTSKNNGRSWKDEGCFLESAELTNSHDYYTIWSGSVKLLPDDKKLVVFTGLKKVDAEHAFVQDIALAISDDGYVVNRIQKKVISSPDRDWKEITGLGYYLDSPEKLGNINGEMNGPILAWRDPFIFLDENEQINLFWGGKVSARKGALVRALLSKNEDGYSIKKLFPPVTVPDGDQFTQLELPKVLYDKERELYYLIISSCNRLYEGQSDSEVDKGVRIYKSESIEGPWDPLGDKILGKEHLFGLTVLDSDFKNNRLLCIAPYTDAAVDHLSLTFSPVFYVHLNPLLVEFL